MSGDDYLVDCDASSYEVKYGDYGRSVSNNDSICFFKMSLEGFVSTLGSSLRMDAKFAK